MSSFPAAFDAPGRGQHVEPLLSKEVLGCTNPDNKNPDLRLLHKASEWGFLLRRRVGSAC